MDLVIFPNPWCFPPTPPHPTPAARTPLNLDPRQEGWAEAVALGHADEGWSGVREREGPAPCRPGRECQGAGSRAVWPPVVGSMTVLCLALCTRSENYCSYLETHKAAQPNLTVK